MPDFNLRSDSVNVEQIMEQIRARIREKRGADYTEEEIRQLATVKLEKFLDPRGVRSDLLDQFRRAQPPYQPPELPNYAFEEQTLFYSTRGPLRWIRRLLLPILKLFFNPNPLIQALNIQSRLNTVYAEQNARREAGARSVDQLQYEVLHNLVVELTRTSPAESRAQSPSRCCRNRRRRPTLPLPRSPPPVLRLPKDPDNAAVAGADGAVGAAVRRRPKSWVDRRRTTPTPKPARPVTRGWTAATKPTISNRRSSSTSG
jgi:hypothetical protein